MMKIRKKPPKRIPSILLEHLPNEIFIKIFSYLNGVDAVFAFSYLNNRFQSLLIEYCHFFDFKSISKAKFEHVCQKHDIQRWKSLQLSNDDDTPGQIEYFCHFYSLTVFCLQLESLSILKLKIEHNYDILFDQLQSLTNIKSLKIESICGEKMSKFNLRILKHLVLSSCKKIKWIQNFFQLESLDYNIINCCFHQEIPTWPLTLKRLKIIFLTDEDIVFAQKLLTHLPQLIILEIYQKVKGRLQPNGQLWEQIIHSSIPSLKIFKFYFQFIYKPYSFSQIEQIMASFSTSFYVLEKSWFVRCHVSSLQSIAAIYTEPFAFDQFTIFTDSLNKRISTNLTDNDHIYTNVKTLVFKQNLLQFDESFNRIEVINLVLDGRFNSINWVYILTKLRQLEIKDDTIISSENFCLLLDNTPYLYSLITERKLLRALTQNWSNVFICNHLSQKIRSLKLVSSVERLPCLSRNELQKIIRIFASKCRHLSLSVQSPNNTISLILRMMVQLHSLHVNIVETLHPIITLDWLDQQKTKYNHSNCVIVKEDQDYYFWLGINP